MTEEILNIIGTFLNCCEKGNLKMAKRLFVVDPLMIQKQFFLEGFGIACQFGHHSFLEWMLKIHPTLDLSFQNEFPFRLTLINNQWETAKWLLKLKPSINLSVMDELPFHSVCLSGNVEMVKWFLDIHTTLQQSPLFLTVFENAFHGVCLSNHLEIAKLLYTIHPISIDEKIFRGVCIKGYDEMIIWMISISSFSVSSFPLNMDHPVLSLCTNRHEYLVKTICKRFPQWQQELQKDVELLGRCIYFSTLVKNIQIVKWLLSLDTSKDPSPFILTTLFTSCKRNMKSVMKLLCNRFTFDSFVYLVSLQNACSFGNIQIAKYLLTKIDSNVLFTDSLPINDENLLYEDVDYVKGNLLFYNACMDGYVHIAYWLYKQFPQVINGINFNDMFCKLTFSRNERIIRFIYNHFGSHIDLSYDQETPFRNLALNNDLSMVKWILREKPTIDICANNHDAIEQAFRHSQGKYEVVQYLTSLRPDMYRFIFTSTGHNLIINRTLQITSQIEISTVETCIVCYEEATVQTNCKHFYCESCIQKSFHMNQSCPYCRQSLTYLNGIISNV